MSQTKALIPRIFDHPQDYLRVFPKTFVLRASVLQLCTKKILKK